MHIHANMGWPQVILVSLILMGMGVSMARYGEQKRDSYGFIDLIVAPVVTLSLLYWGGFFG